MHSFFFIELAYETHKNGKYINKLDSTLFPNTRKNKTESKLKLVEEKEKKNLQLIEAESA